MKPKGENSRMVIDKQFAFTKERLAQIPLPADGALAYYKDTKQSGLQLYITSTGVITFFVRKRVQGRDERLLIGKYDGVSIEQARTKAKIFIGLTAQKIDPKAKEKEERKQRRTFGELFNEYMEKYSKLYKKSWIYDEREVNRHVGHWFKKRLSSISKEDVVNLHVQVAKNSGKTQANTIAKRLSSIFNKGIEWGYCSENPALGIKRFKENSRERFILPFEMPYFLKALKEEPNETIRDFFWTLLLTGVRKSDALKMQWSQVDLQQGLWRIPETKNGDSITVPLVPEIIEILTIRRESRTSQWVFPQEDTSKHIIDPIKAWHRILGNATLAILKDHSVHKSWIQDRLRYHPSYLSPFLKVRRLKKQAEEKEILLEYDLTDIRIHDIRRTFGSYQAIQGSSLHVIGKSLGHRSLKSTQIYARLNLDPIRASMNQGVSAILGNQTI